jgi:HK97 family phage prohead protease
LTVQIETKNLAFKADKVADDGTFTGYASVFSNVDAYREIVAPGAFADSLKRIKESGDPLPILWQHRSGEPIGGSDKLEEDKYGLKVAGWLLTNEVPRAREALALMKRRVVKGLSIGYYVEADSYDEKNRIRTLLKIDLQEYSLVTFAANELAKVETVKSFDQLVKSGRLPTLPEFENFLREAGGFSKSQATVVAGHGLSKLLSRSESGGNPADALQLLKQWNFKLP